MKNNVPEITDLLRFLPMLEVLGGKALEVDYLNNFQTDDILYITLFMSSTACFTTRRVLYGGNLNTTPLGYDCEPWIRYSTYTKGNWGVELQYFPEASFEEAEDFCRDPTTLNTTPWCFTSPPDNFEWCDIPAC